MHVEKGYENKKHLMTLIDQGVEFWNNNRPYPQQLTNGYSIENAVDLSGLDFSKRDFRGIDLSNVNLKGAKFHGADLSNSNLSLIITNGETSFKEAVLDKTNLNKAQFFGGSLEKASLICADLSAAQVNVVNLNGVNLKGVKVNTKTTFGSITKCDKCKVDKSTLNNLKKYDGTIGGFHAANLKEMIISDDFEKLKMSFSGFWKTVHLVSLVFFIFPYAFFLFKLWSISHGFHLFDPSTDVTATIGGKFWEYVYSAGALDGKFSPWSLVALLLIIYNFCRVLLLWKTLTLEHKESVTGLDVDFELNFWWKILFKIVTYGVVFNLLFVIIHTLNFLSRPLTG